MWKLEIAPAPMTATLIIVLLFCLPGKSSVPGGVAQFVGALSQSGFVSAEQGSTSTEITPAWSYVEDGMLAVIGNVAGQLATAGGYNASSVSSQLATEQSDVTSHLSS